MPLLSANRSRAVHRRLAPAALAGTLVAPLAAMGLVGCHPTAPATLTTTEVVGPDDIAIGRHLVALSGCNDCHTAGYLEGEVPESQWLKGAPVGFKGPWGVSYAANLRLSTASMSENEWVTMAATRDGRPPMPWPSLKAMTDRERRALYRYIKTLGEPGEPAPEGLAPGVVPRTPVVDMTPR